jgi:hypothetical protein
MQRSFRGWSAGGALAVVAALVAVVWTGSADAQNDAPKPSVTVQGSALYLGKGRDNIVITLSKRGEPSPAEGVGQDDKGKDDKKKEEDKPFTTTSDAKGAFEFKNVAIGKYRMTAKGRPANSLRAYKEADPVDFDVTAESTSPITKNVTLTQDKAK